MKDCELGEQILFGRIERRLYPRESVRSVAHAGVCAVSAPTPEARVVGPGATAEHAQRKPDAIGPNLNFIDALDQFHKCNEGVLRCDLSMPETSMAEENMRALDVMFIDEAPSLMAIDIDENRLGIRSWLLDLRAQMNVTWKRMAEETGVAASTLSRAIQDDGDFVMSTRTIAAICKAYGVEGPRGVTVEAPSDDRHSPEAARVHDAEDEEPLRVGLVTELHGLPPSGRRETWKLFSKALNLAGCMPGDFLVVDTAAEPAIGDVVMVKLFSPRHGAFDTIFRIYEPPYLTTYSTERLASYAPRLIDRNELMIRGVVIEVRRIRDPR